MDNNERMLRQAICKDYIALHEMKTIVERLHDSTHKAIFLKEIESALRTNGRNRERICGKDDLFIANMDNNCSDEPMITL
jgi:hypothetical protein